MATVEHQKETFDKIMRLFDLVENMISSIEHPEVKNTKKQLEVAEHFIRQMNELTETILVTYMDYVKRGSAPTIEESKVMENTARKIFIEIAKFVTQAQQLKLPT